MDRFRHQQRYKRDIDDGPLLLAYHDKVMLNGPQRKPLLQEEQSRSCQGSGSAFRSLHREAFFGHTINHQYASLWPCISVHVFLTFTFRNLHCWQLFLPFL